MALPDDFLKYEVQQIISLQDRFKGFEGVFKFISLSSSPTTAQFLSAPLVTAVLGGSMVDTMITIAAVDYASIILKWLQEHRPFWYVYEPVYVPGARPKLKQFDITCESTSGGPSGHSAMITATMYLFRRWMVEYLGDQNKGRRFCFNIAISSGMVSLIILCWASRMYFGSHFLHQCVSGTGLALSVMLCIEQDYFRRKLLSAKKNKAIGFAIGMMVTAGAMYFGMTQMGTDQMWSVEKALKSCYKTTNVSWETTPLYGISRNLGCTIGIALSAPLRKRMTTVGNWQMNLKSTLGLVLVDSVILANAPQNLGGCMYLAYIFGASVFHTYAMIKIVPWLAKKLDESEEPPLSKEEKDRSDGGEAKVKEELDDKNVKDEVNSEPKGESDDESEIKEEKFDTDAVSTDEEAVKEEHKEESDEEASKDEPEEASAEE